MTHTTTNEQPDEPTPMNANTSDEQVDELDEILLITGPHRMKRMKAALLGWLVHHTKEAERLARNEAINDCIAVIRNKQREDAEELAKRMAALTTQKNGGGDE